MTIKEENKEDTISVRTEEERAKFWLNYGALLAYRHEQGTNVSESDLLDQISEFSMNTAEWTILPLSNKEILDNIIHNISKEELIMIYKAHLAKEQEASLS
jgi:hypothetical protein